MLNPQLGTLSEAPPIDPSTKDPGELLLRIARRRDREAFAELFKRFEKQAYTLAYFLTGSRELAEDAVQEGFLKIWLAAGNFRGQGSAKGWLLRIVAGKSLQVLRSRRRAQSKDECARQLADSACCEAGPDERLACRELQTALCRVLSGLPESDRHLLALYYCGELTQEEIARQLSVSQRTISHRIEKAATQLRRGLAGAGFAPGLTALAPQQLWREVMASVTPPPSLWSRTLERLATAPHPQGFGTGSRPAVRKGVIWCVAAATATIAAASLALGVWPRPAAVPEESRPPAPRQEDGPQSPVFRTLARWDFNSTELPKEVLVRQGSCRRLPDQGPDGSGCLEMDYGSVLLLDVPISRLPVLLEWRNSVVLPQPPDFWAVAVRWADSGEAAMINGITQPKAIKSTQWISRRALCAEGYIVDQYDSERIFSIAVGRRRDVQARLLFGVRGRHRIDDLTIREAGPSEIPDLSEYLAAVERIEPGRRVGRVPLPGCLSRDTGRALAVEFFPAAGFKRPPPQP